MRKVIENYSLVEIVGEGMYGKVYKAVHMQTHVEYAIKVIPVVKFQQNPKLQECTVNEINILTTIETSPYIIRYIQMLKTPNNFYFVYEYCNEKTLQSLLKQEKKLSQAKALKIFKQLIEAFKILNKYNIMHRDLKPDNIFFHNGNLKLGDFGFCKTLAKSSDMASTMLGSPIYMAPEVLKGEIYTSKADIWSLGVVLFQMLFGYCPFESNSIAKLISVLEGTQLKLPLEINPISKSTQNLLKRILTKDQFKRIDWFQLLQYNISEEGTMDSKKETNRLEELKQVFSQKEIDKQKYNDGNKNAEGVNYGNGNEMLFKKKVEINNTNSPSTMIQTTNSPTTIIQQKPNGITQTRSPKVPSFEQSKRTSFQYNFANTGSKKYYEENKSADTSINNTTANSTNGSNSNTNTPTQSNPLHRKPSMTPIQQFNVNSRRRLLEEHALAVNSVKTAINMIKSEEQNCLIYSYMIFSKVEERLKKLQENASNEQDISQTIGVELKHIERQLSQLRQEIVNCGNQSLINTASKDWKGLLRKQFKERSENNNSTNQRYFYELVCCLNNDRPSISPGDLNKLINQALA